jgi:hypothetical protein
VIAVLVLLLILLPSIALAAEKKTDAMTITAVAPLAVSPGRSIVKLVGVKVDKATGVLVGDACLAPATQPTTQVATGSETQPATLPATQPSADVLSVRLKDKGTVAVPKGAEAAHVGDVSIDVELNVPADMPDGDMPLVLTSPAGRSAVVLLLVKRAASIVDVKNPHNGFRDAQPIELGKWMRGTVESPGDVHVYRLTGKSGQTIVAEVLARRRCSLLDSLLVLYDERGNVLAENDDFNGADSLLRFPLPADGTYFLSLTDADDRGNAGFPYLLSVTIAQGTR